LDDEGGEGYRETPSEDGFDEDSNGLGVHEADETVGVGGGEYAFGGGTKNAAGRRDPPAKVERGGEPP
jgi:hypothetical protein